ncbi:hypothetical protein ACWDY7_33250, partial [Streptomyces calvus]
MELHQADERAVAEVAARLVPAEGCTRGLDALGFTDLTGDGPAQSDATAQDDEDDVESVLSDIKAHPGNVSLNSLLDEISKLKQVRTVGIPEKAPGSAYRSWAPRQFRLDQSVVGPGVPLTDAQWARIEPLLPDRTP